MRRLTARGDDARAALAHARPTRQRSDHDATQPPSPFAEEAREALGASWEACEEELFGPDETLHATFQALRDELLGDVQRTGARLGELRFDTDLDVSHAVVRYLEILKLAALLERPAGQSVADALPDINQRLLSGGAAAAARGLTSSTLDDVLLDAERDDRARSAAAAARSEPSLEAVPARAGATASRCQRGDIETYRSCPLRYKFARVLRIPQEPTLTSASASSSTRCSSATTRPGGTPSTSCSACWRRAGGAAASGTARRSASCAVKATDSLRRYHERVRSERADPVWFERGFSFRMGRHTVRGRVDRVDRLAEGGWELIDYKTGRPRTVAELREDVQLSLYAIGAREAWDLESAEQAYLYVLDDEKVRVPTEEMDPDWITETVLEVARRHPGAGLRADAVVRGVRDLRLPDRLPRRGTVRGRLAAAPRHVLMSVGASPAR